MHTYKWELKKTVWCLQIMFSQNDFHSLIKTTICREANLYLNFLYIPGNNLSTLQDMKLYNCIFIKPLRNIGKNVGHENLILYKQGQFL